ncbi:hypothetical protein FCV25MIE_09762 [Fagus crenata]
MIGVAAKLSRKANSTVRSARLGPNSNTPYLFCQSPPFRTLHGGINGSDASPVALQMINYALSHARSQKSDESYGQGLLVLEQCLSTQLSEEGQHPENSMGLVLLAMSTLFSERGNFDDAIEKLQRIEDLTHSSLGVRVSAMEALVGLHLELGQDDASSVIADKCLELVEKEEPKTGGGNSVPLSAVLRLRGWSLVCGNLESAETFLQGCGNSEGITGSAALSYGESLHAMRHFSLAKERKYCWQPLVLWDSLRHTWGNAGAFKFSLIQEGLYRKAIELLKAPPLETNDAEAKVDRSDIVALARGGYAEALCVQQNRKVQGEKMKSWAEAAWRNRRLSLGEALEISEPSSKVHVIDTRTCRVL